MRAAIRQILFGETPFSPRRLFLAGEQGVWYDPSDFSTMFQDSSGTTPVTAIEQPVGLILDKSGRGNHATQSVPSIQPILKQDEFGFYYLFFDGTDDFLVTSNINFSGTDKMSVFVGIRKLSDANVGVIVELTDNAATTNGGFCIFAPISTGADGDYLFATRGTVQYGGGDTTVLLAPRTNVISCNFNNTNSTALTQTNPRINGVNVSELFNSQTTSAGNYANAPLYIGRRGANTLRFNGRVYSLVVRAAETAAPLLWQTERWVAAKTGVTL